MLAGEEVNGADLRLLSVVTFYLLAAGSLQDLASQGNHIYAT